MQKEIVKFDMIYLNENNNLSLQKLDNCEFYDDLRFIYFVDVDKKLHNYKAHYLFDFKTGYIFIQGESKKQLENKYFNQISKYNVFIQSKRYEELEKQYKELKNDNNFTN